MSTKICTKMPLALLFQLARELQSTYLAVNIINSLCSFVAVLGNVVMILAILRNSSLRHNPSFMLLCTLAISDLGVGLISQPLSVALLVEEAKGDIELSCKIIIAFNSTVGCLGVLSFLTITAISFDRFLAVHLRLNYRSVVTVTRMKVVILLLWLVSMLSGITYALSLIIFQTLSIIIICLCLTFATFNYLAVAHKLYGHNAQLQARNREVDGTNQRNSFNIGQYKKTLKSMLYVYGAFLMCYLPFLCCTITLRSIGRTTTVQAMYRVTGTFVLANSAINPCLYYWRITELRKAVQKLFGLNRLAVLEATPTCISESKL